MKKRFKAVSLIAILILTAGIFRFFYLCIYKHEEYSAAAQRQRVEGTELEPVRGVIYDRNMIPLTDREDKLIAYKMPDSSIYNIHVTQRYDQNSLAKAVTGYVRSDGQGETGIEGFYNEYLRSDKTREIVIVKDAMNNPIKGFGYTIRESQGEDPLSVKLTLDYGIQKICEEVFEKNNITGAFVFQDAKTGDILAMGSFPDYEHGHIAEYLNSDKGELTNRATMSYSLGSVFKTVVAAAAIEEELDLEYSYYCPGYVDVDGMEFKCHTYSSGGHGIIGMKNAFAKSCNTFFIDLGLELGMERIVNMAKLFGFGEKTGLYEQGINESEGNLPDLNGIINNRAIANLSIGQGEMLATPLQVTNAITAVANGGVILKPNIVEGIIDGKGQIIKQIKYEESKRIIKESTAEILKEYMKEVTLSGTAAESISAAGLSGIYRKTGSAETGKYTEDGQIVHSWFSGFYDVGDSRYTLTVFIENGVTLSQSAVKIFAEIASLTSTK